MTMVGPIPINRGWISDSDYFNCPQGGALTFQSFTPWGNGSIKTIDGYDAFSGISQFSTGILGMTFWQDPAQIGVHGPIMVVCTAGVSTGKIFTSPDFSTFTDRTGGTSPTPSQFYTFDSLNGNLLFFDGSTPLVLTTYNGNVSNLGGSPPNGGAVKVVNNFAFVSNVLTSASTVSTLYWSAVADPTTWPAGNFLTFRNNDGDFNTGLGAVGNYLLIFKRYSFASLNTSSTVISGAVTLGPLVTVSDRIGCCSPNAVDNLPDGTCVFLAMNRCLYQTDGSTVVNLSDLPSPNSNYNLSVNFFPSFNRPIVSGSGVFVRVDPLQHRIWVLIPPSSGTESSIFVYDYYLKAWMDWSELSNDLSTGTGDGQIQCLGILPNQIQNNFGLANSVWTGSSTGYTRTYNPYVEIQHNSASKSWPCVFETSFQLNAMNPPDFIPRNLIVPYSNLNSGSIFATVQIGWDGVYQSTAAVNNVNISAAYGRLIVPVGEFPDSSGIHPITMQIKITLTANTAGGPTVIEPLYLTDEVTG